MKSKTIGSILIILAFVLGGIYYWQFYRQPAPGADVFSKISLGADEALVFFDFGSANPQRFFAGQVVEGMTLLDALTVSAAAGNLDLEIAGNVGEEKIVKINGLIDGRDGGSWNYYRGGAKITNTLSAQLIRPGDRIKFVYEPR
ncbi:MAG: hypothetical protein Q8L57_00010 [bacterium]|nr:hypothetical protein [bacterium]